MPATFHAIQNSIPWFFPLLAGVIGACAGSFLNVCILRIPAGESIARPRSRCRSCGAAIAWHDNIPVLGWFALRGRARCCGRPFSVRYPFIEALTAALFVACWLLFAPVSPAKALCGMVFCSALVGAAFIDIDHFKIPDTFTVWLAALGMVLSILAPSLHGQTGALRSGLLGLEGMLIGSALLLWIALAAETLLRKEAMGFGDVTFLGAIGAFCGWQGAVVAIFGGAIIGTLWVAGMVVFGKLTRKKILLKPLEPDAAPAELGMSAHVPFGPMLAAGALVYFLWLHHWVDARIATLVRVIWA
jgi:leader peptidase (prepilin peptidase)/N-methyltransferase